MKIDFTHRKQSIILSNCMFSLLTLFLLCGCQNQTKEETEEVKEKIKANPREYIAQPKMMLSCHATYIEDLKQFEPRYIDLRTFALMGKDRSYILPGGLTRVALKRDSLIVNSSQGGGSKDTWVMMN